MAGKTAINVLKRSAGGMQYYREKKKKSDNLVDLGVTINYSVQIFPSFEDFSLTLSMIQTDQPPIVVDTNFE